MMDRREELGMDPEGISARHCSLCGELHDAVVTTDDFGNRANTCMQCGNPLGLEGPAGFDQPENP